MRQNVKLHYEQDEPVYVYSHWKGGDDRNDRPLANDVRRALARQERWSDESYLARIIISEIIKDDIEGETGYGIAPYPVDEEFPTIEVNFPEQTVNGIPYDKFVSLYRQEV